MNIINNKLIDYGDCIRRTSINHNDQIGNTLKQFYFTFSQVLHFVKTIQNLKSIQLPVLYLDNNEGIYYTYYLDKYYLLLFATLSR